MNVSTCMVTPYQLLGRDLTGRNVTPQLWEKALLTQYMKQSMLVEDNSLQPPITYNSL